LQESKKAKLACNTDFNVPIISNIDHANRTVRAVALGRIVFQDVEDHLKLERYFKGLLYQELIDARPANVNFTSEDLRRVVALVRKMSVENKFGPTAVIVSTDVEFAVMKVIQALVDDVAVVSPFRSEVEAQVWLDGRGALNNR
jgi:hypothetical protein